MRFLAYHVVCLLLYACVYVQMYVCLLLCSQDIGSVELAILTHHCACVYVQVYVCLLLSVYRTLVRWSWRSSPTTVRVRMFRRMYACYSLFTGHWFSGARDPHLPHRQHDHQHLLCPVCLITAPRPHQRQGNQGLLQQDG